MATTPSLQFKKGALFTENFEQGTVYFETSTHLLKVGINDSSYEVYSGVRSAAFTDNVLTIVNEAGAQLQLDFNDVPSGQAVNSLLAGLRTDINNLQSATGIADGSTRVNFVDTHYLNGESIDVSTIYDAITTLDTAIYTASENAGVTSFGGKKGAITLADASDASGAINLEMSQDGSTLSATIVGLDTAAYKTVEFFVGTTEDALDASTILGVRNYATERIDGVEEVTAAALTQLDSSIQAIDASMAAMNGTIGISVNNNGIVTIAGNIAQTNGVVSNTSDAGVTLAKVATTGAAADVSITDADDKFTATDVEGALLEVRTLVDAAVGGMRYNGVISSATATLNALTNDVRPGDIYLANGAFTIDTITVESGDMIIYKGTASESAVALTPENCNVIERESDLMVTATADLSDDYVVLGGGNKTAKASTVTVTELTTAITDASNAIKTVEKGTDGDYVTTTVNGGGVNDASASIGVAITKGVIDTSMASTTAGILTTENLANMKAYVDDAVGTAVQSVTSTDDPVTAEGDYVHVAVNASTDSNTNDVTLSTTVSVEIQEVSTADPSTNGLATAYDVQQYVQQNSVMTWAHWD